jgi:hypothetical protein
MRDGALEQGAVSETVSENLFQFVQVGSLAFGFLHGGVDSNTNAGRIIIEVTLRPALVFARRRKPFLRGVSGLACRY